MNVYVWQGAKVPGEWDFWSVSVCGLREVVIGQDLVLQSPIDALERKPTPFPFSVGSHVFSRERIQGCRRVTTGCAAARRARPPYHRGQ